MRTLSIAKAGCSLIAILLALSGSAMTGAQAAPVIKTTQQDWVNAVAFSPDGSQLAIGVLGQVISYSCPDGQPRGNGDVHSKYVQGLAFAPDGASLYSIGWDGLLCGWRIDRQGRIDPTPVLRKTLAASRPQCLAVFPDGDRIATNGDGNDLDVFDAESLAKVATYSGLKSTPYVVAVDPVRNRVVAGDKKGNLAVWNLVGGKLLKVWDGHGGRTIGLAIDRVSGDLLSCDDKGELKRWDPENFKETAKRSFKESTRGLQVSRDGQFVYVALKSGEIQLLGSDLESVAAPLKVAGRPNSLALDARGRYLACGTDRNELFAWDLLDIREVQIAYDTPASLEIEADYDDVRALVPNRALDGGEKVRLNCTVRNVGAGTAYDARLNISCDNADVSFPASIALGDLLTGSTKEVPIPLEVALEARDGSANFTLHVTEKKRNGARTKLGITVRYLPKPDLAVTDIRLVDQNSGSTSGNGNGVPENGETVEVEFYLKNQGAGPAWENRLQLTRRTPGVTVLVGELDLPPIPAYGATSGRVRLSIPKTFAGESLFVEALISDAVTGHRVEAKQSWGARQNTPVLAADWRVIEELRNGRPARLQMRLLNQGTMAAENLNISVTNDQGLRLRQSVTKVPRISAGGEDPGVTLDLDIPREFQQERVTLRARVDQANFPASSFSHVFDIALARPVLLVQGLDEGMTLTQGGELYLDLYVQNNGDLDAEDVQVSVTSRELELNHRQSLDAIRSGGMPGMLEKISWPVPFAISDSVDLKIQVTQRHFASIEIDLRLKVVEAHVARQNIQATTATTGPMAAGSVAGGSGSGQGQTQGIEVGVFGLPEVVHDPNQPFKLIVNAPNGIDIVECSVNGELIYSLAQNPQQLALLQSTGNRYLQADMELAFLRPGIENTLKISVADANKETGQLNRTLTYEPLGFDLSAELDLSIDVNTPPRVPNRRNTDAVAVLIGVSRYKNRGCYVEPVRYARQDVLAMKETLKHTLGYLEENIIVLLDEDATKNTIMNDVLGWELPQKVKPNRSDVFVYFAGHGAPNYSGDGSTVKNQNGYLMTHEANPAPLRIRRTALPLDEFYRELGNIEARSMVVAIDACFSGKVENGTEEFGQLVEAVSPILMSKKRTAPDLENCVVFTASGVEEMSSWYPDMKHGLFTYFFLKGLQGGVGKGKVTAKEFERYLQKHVSETAMRRGLPQKPQCNGKPDFVILDDN